MYNGKVNIISQKFYIKKVHIQYHVYIHVFGYSQHSSAPYNLKHVRGSSNSQLKHSANSLFTVFHITQQIGV